MRFRKMYAKKLKKSPMESCVEEIIKGKEKEDLVYEIMDKNVEIELQSRQIEKLKNQLDALRSEAE